MIGIIALKEIRENLLSLRFMFLLLLAVIFIPSSLYTKYLPEFRLPQESAAGSLQGGDLAILLAWFLVAASLTYGALARYDVRRQWFLAQTHAMFWRLLEVG